MSINKEQLLLAENTRLKRMMKRMYEGMWGGPFHPDTKDKAVSSGYLPLYLSSLLARDKAIEQRISEALEALGRFADVSRIYIFENHADELTFSNTYEWCNEAVLPAKESLQKLSYDNFKAWKQILIDDGYLKASDIHTLPREITEKLASQGIQSVLAYPLWVKERYYGFIGFDECSFQREWLPHETDLLQMASRLIAHAFEREEVASDLRRSHAEILNVNRELADKEQFLQNLLSSAPIGIILVKDHIIQYVNDATMKQSGYSKDELEGESLANLYYEGKRNPAEVQQFYDDIDRLGVASLEARMRGKDGGEMVIRVLGTRAPKGNGDNSYLLIGEDVTQVKKTENHLRESEERNRKLIEATIDGIFIIDEQKHIVYANMSACEMLNYSHEEIFKLCINDVFPNTTFVEGFIDTLGRVKKGDDYKGDTQLIGKEGQVLHAEIYVTTLNLEGKLHYYVSVHNITKRKNNEASLRSSEQKFRALTENSRDHILRINNHAELSFCNAAFLKDFELDERSCVGHKLKSIKALPKELVEGLMVAVDHVLVACCSSTVEIEYRFKDTIRTFDWTLTPETDNSHISSLLIVGRDYTQRKKAEQELLEAKEKAVGADKLKSAFLANMSHEIRTPLNAIVGFTNLLKEEGISEEEKTEYIDIVNKSSENLMDLINDIVDLAKIESGELSLEKEMVNIGQLMSELYHIYQKRMALDQKNHLKFYLNLPDNEVEQSLNCDPRRVRQVLNNLLANAFKFTQKGFIEFGYTTNDHELRFYVRDTGIGIPGLKQSFVFEPFRQADESTSKHYGGTGLGLSICKRLVSAHGGSIGLVSEEETGSEFYFTLPLQKTPLASKKIMEEVSEGKKRPAGDISVETCVVTRANYTWPNKMMLLIDATSTAQLQMRKVLDRTRITLISARTQKSARELLLKRNDIHIVLMDLEMPGLELSNFISDIRQLGIYVPVIGQTSKPLSEEERNRYLRMGFSNVFQKPVDADRLLHAFNEALSGVPV
ncbi:MULTISPECIES: PAS domain S-box protein [unclassified Carboxylicivirga]|uniref:PAS domain S-box protein n=1 Tax=Carboxylicivirga TaxID=1628153 RepID=UPI003D34FB55